MSEEVKVWRVLWNFMLDNEFFFKMRFAVDILSLYLVRLLLSGTVVVLVGSGAQVKLDDFCGTAGK